MVTYSACILAVCNDLFAESEVDQYWSIELGEHYVTWLNVSVYDSLAVQGVETIDLSMSLLLTIESAIEIIYLAFV